MKPRTVIWAGLFFAALIPSAGAREFFVSQDGRDDRAGTREQPLKTIQRAAQLMNPGDVCTIRGGVYRESVKPVRSGTQQAPIVFRAYPDESVTVSGTEVLTGWQRDASGYVWAAFEGKAEQLFVDGQMMTLARWPNASLDPFQPAWAACEAGSTAGSIRHSQWPAGQFEGGYVKLLPGQGWVATTRPILGLSGSRLEFDPTPFRRSDFDYSVKPGTPFYLAGAPELLDVPREWCPVPSKKQIWLRVPGNDSPGQHVVEVKRRKTGLSLQNLSWVRLEGLRFFACTVDMGGSGNCAMARCHLLYPDYFEECDAYKTGWSTGVVVSGHDNLVEGCSIERCAGNGLSIQGERNTIRDSLVRKVNYAAVECSAIWAQGFGHVIEHCTLTDSGRSVINHGGLKAGRIRFNELARAGLLTRDCGLTYAWGDNGQGTEICYNWVHDNQGTEQPHYGCGIYLDDGCSNFRVHHNVCWGMSDVGIQIGAGCSELLFAFNTVINRPLSVGMHELPGKTNTRTLLINNILAGPCQTLPGPILVNNVAVPLLKGSPVDLGEDSQAQEIRKMAAPYLTEEVRTRPARPRSSWDFRPAPGSPCINQATPIEQFTDPPGGQDIGAYESSEPLWVPGHSWGEPPKIWP